MQKSSSSPNANSAMNTAKLLAARNAHSTNARPPQFARAQTRLAFLSVDPIQSNREPPSKPPAMPVITVTPPKTTSADVPFMLYISRPALGPQKAKTPMTAAYRV